MWFMNIKYLLVIALIALFASSVSLYKIYSISEQVGFDDPDAYDITEIPIKLAVYLIDKNVRLANERLQVVSALQEVIIARQEAQNTLNIETDRRLTAEEMEQ